MEKKNWKTLFLYMISAFVFISAIVFATAWVTPSITNMIKDIDTFRDLLISYRFAGVFLFVFFQVLQVVVAAIPGEAFQLAGGYVYGTIPGSLYSMTGLLLGSLLAFFLARIIGYPIVELFVPEKVMRKFEFLFNSKKFEIVMLILFIMPGIPKDALVYIAGITPVNVPRFFFTTTIARIPPLLVSSYIGANLQEKDYSKVIIVSIVSFAFFLAGVLTKDKILARFNKQWG